jgi:hypothetical protein
MKLLDLLDPSDARRGDPLDAVALSPSQSGPNPSMSSRNDRTLLNNLRVRLLLDATNLLRSSA